MSKIKGSRETYLYVINEQARHITGRGYYCESQRVGHSYNDRVNNESTRINWKISIKVNL